MKLAITIPLVILAVFFFFITVNNVYTKTYDIERFNRAKETIHSPITIEHESETDRKVRESVQSVEDRFDVSDDLTEERLDYIEEIFEITKKMSEEQAKDATSETDESDGNSNKELLTQLKQVLSSDITSALDDKVLLQLIHLKADEQKKLEKLIKETIKESMDRGVRADNIESIKNEAIQTIEFEGLTEQSIELATSLTDYAIIENSFFDADRTMEARKEAASNVEPVMIRAGEVIVSEGQIITNEIYEELELTGLLKEERNIFPVIGLSLLIIIIITVMAIELFRLHRRNLLKRGAVLAIFFISILVVTLMKVSSLFSEQMSQIYFVVPIATGVLLIKQLIAGRMAIVLSTLYAILGSIIFNNYIPGSLNVEAGIYFYFSQISAIVLFTNIRDRLSLLRAGVGIAVVNVITVLSFLFLSFEKYALIDFMLPVIFAVISAILSAVLTIGFLPFFETGLGMLSDVKLLSLANPNQPLLRKLLIEAPGTYHHSIMVANLSELACETIGANGLLARVGAYYHDIGKTVSPHYFIENQVSIKNPHDFIEPEQSAKIIINHPYDGAKMLKEYQLPKEIIDIAKQHHGTTLLKFFYFKEKESNEAVDEAKFRYPGPKPQTKEAAVICICDSVEAAVRSLKEPTKEKIDEIVSSIIKDRLMDGQLDESSLTLGEINEVKAVICETLKGIFHSRIQYPDEEAN